MTAFLSPAINYWHRTKEQFLVMLCAPSFTITLLFIVKHPFIAGGIIGLSFYGLYITVLKSLFTGWLEHESKIVFILNVLLLMLFIASISVVIILFDLKIGNL